MNAEVAQQVNNFWGYMVTLGISGALLLFNYLDRRLYTKALEKLTQNFVALAQESLKANQAQELVLDKLMEVVRILKKD